MIAADRSAAQALDEADPLGAFLERFEPIESGLIYLDGNSLGRLPADTPQRINAVVGHEWGERLIRGWDEGWMALPTTIGDRLATGLLGANPGEVALADSTSVNFFKLAAAALHARPDRREIITDHENFPTDRYVLEGLIERTGHELVWTRPADAAAAVNEDTALVTFSHVDYRTAELYDMAGITHAAHEAGALTLWDLSHSAGAVPVELERAGADLAVGCTYKYLNGGPGSPAFLYVRAEHQAQLRQPIWGWLGRHDPFAMAPGYIPGDGILQTISGTPPVLGLTAAACGIELSIEAGIETIRDKSTQLTEYAIELADALLADHGVSVGSPRDRTRRGGHVSLTHPDARTLTRRLAQRDVIADFREPDVIRLGLSPLTTRFGEVYEALTRLAQLLATPGA